MHAQEILILLCINIRHTRTISTSIRNIDSKLRLNTFAVESRILLCSQIILRRASGETYCAYKGDCAHIGILVKKSHKIECLKN